MSTNIYILELKDNCFYVGKSNDPEKRFIDHLEGNGATWTIIHEPICILKIIENASDFDEDRYVKEFMAMYGIDKVRGGSYCQNVLDDYQMVALKREIFGAIDLCMNCGKSDHFIKDCPVKIVQSKIIQPKKSIPVKNIKYKKSNQCYRCGREGHFVADCYAKTHQNGYYLKSNNYYDDSDSDSDDYDTD
jgi:hypothetical protein